MSTKTSVWERRGGLWDSIWMLTPGWRSELGLSGQGQRQRPATPASAWTVGVKLWDLFEMTLLSQHLGPHSLVPRLTRGRAPGLPMSVCVTLGV